MPPELPAASATPGRGRHWLALPGLFALGAGALALAGWTFNLPRLADWLNTGIAMLPNTAVCAMALGIAVVFLARPGRGRGANMAVGVLAGFVAAVGGLTLSQHLTGLNLGIDTLLIQRPWGQRAAMAPMRMGPPAATSYLLLGICLMLVLGGSRQRRLASLLALGPVAIASLSLTGYWFGAGQLFGVAGFTGIAFQTGVVIAILGLAVVMAIPEHGIAELVRRRDAGGVVARRLLLPIIFIPFLLGWARVLAERSGLVDLPFGTASRTLIEIGLFLVLLWWTANAISRQARAAGEAERALRASDERFTRFMQSLPGLSWIKDAAGRYVYANDAALRTFGRTREELHGRTDPEIFPPETAAHFQENDRLALASPLGLQTVESLRHEDGLVHYSLVSKFPITGETGEPTLVGGMAIDITDRIRAEEALRESDRRKDEFLATLAHELRNPLAPIRHAVQFFQRGLPEPDTLRQMHRVIDRQVQQMVRLLDDLLDISRITHGKLELRREHTDLAAAVDCAVEASRPLVESAGHKLSVRLPSAPIPLDADPVRLAQICSNLLNNAAKFTGEKGEITLTVARDATHATIIVEDNGTGIPPEALTTIFGMFAQAGRDNSNPQTGLGVGLALVKGLVDLHGGTVKAESAGPGRGSKFTVRLPALAAGETQPANAPAETNAAARPASRRILIVDDAPDNADSIALFLGTMNHEVRTAYNGRDALATMEKFHPDILLLDIGMPGMNGHDVCREVRSRPGGDKVLIVAITGWGQESDRRRTRESGFDHHLVKPVEIKSLLALLS